MYGNGLRSRLPNAGNTLGDPDIIAQVPGVYGVNDAIHFNISGGGVHTITPGTSLPNITKPVVIDGYSQSGASANTLAVGDNAQLRIRLDGSTSGGAGLTIGSAVRLAIRSRSWQSALMMSTRVLLAGILGGIAMFVWTAIAHMFITPFGEAGVREIPDEQSVVALKSAIGDQSGFYIFPGPGLGANPTREQRSEGMKRMAEDFPNHASGLLIYHPPGRPFNFAKYLGTEFVNELIEAILVVFLLTRTRLQSFGARVGFVFVAGILAAIATNIPYWNWYGFPGNYTAAYMLIQIIGFTCTGIVAALVLPRQNA
jgi:hypothetical protein